MFIRSILIPSLAVCALCAPILLTQNNVSAPRPGKTDFHQPLVGHQAAYPAQSPNLVLPRAELGALGGSNPGATLQSQNAPRGNFNRTIATPPVNPASRKIPFGLVTSSQPVSPGTTYSPPAFGTNRTVVAPPSSTPPPFGANPVSTPAFSPPVFMPNAPPTTATPDWMAAETFVFPGDEFGPDLTASPMEFLPVTDFRQVLRFDATPSWIKSRWKRVSTNPAGDGLHGLRVALVTGTNSWDLSGSLTYFFDTNQQVQRITFRGWTGDASKLIELLSSQFGFKAQPTHLAGFYEAKKWRKKTGAMLMKYPPVISADNPSQQLAIILEINNPKGSFALSDDFQSLIDGSHTR